MKIIASKLSRIALVSKLSVSRSRTNIRGRKKPKSIRSTLMNSSRMRQKLLSLMSASRTCLKIKISNVMKTFRTYKLISVETIVLQRMRMAQKLRLVLA